MNISKYLTNEQKNNVFGDKDNILIHSTKSNEYVDKVTDSSENSVNIQIKTNDIQNNGKNSHTLSSSYRYVSDKSVSDKDVKEYYDSKKMHIEIQDAACVNAEKSAFLYFKYDKEWVSIVKALPERYWNMDTKTWEIPLRLLPNIQMQIPDNQIIIEENKYDKTIPNDFEFKSPPLDHQIQAIEYGLNHPAFLNGDQQGLGKTYEALMTAEIRHKQKGFDHILILCGVGSLQQNWKKEIEQFTDHKAVILGRRYTKNGTLKQPSTKDKMEDLKNIDMMPLYIITNIESLSNPKIADVMSDLCVNKINMIIFDEIQKCKSPTGKTGKALLRMNSQYKIGLSGTPMMNTPLDIYLFLRWIGAEPMFWWQFRKRYQILKEIHLKKTDENGNHPVIKIPVGYQHLDEIQNKLDHFMIRRLKNDVLDLPNKIYKTEYLEMSPNQTKIYNEIRAQMLENADKIKESENPLAEFIRLRQATADTSLVSSSINESVKLDRMEDIVAETVENGGKILIFSFYREIVNNILKRLKKYHPASILRDTVDPEAEKERFKTETDVMVGTIKVMGTGHTLTEATTVLFIDQPWTEADLEQAEDRAHRIGQTKPVSYITLICSNTVDERVNEIVGIKKDISDMLVDKKKTLSIDYLLANNRQAKHWT